MATFGVCTVERWCAHVKVTENGDFNELDESVSNWANWHSFHENAYYDLNDIIMVMRYNDEKKDEGKGDGRKGEKDYED